MQNLQRWVYWKAWPSQLHFVEQSIEDRGTKFVERSKCRWVNLTSCDEPATGNNNQRAVASDLSKVGSIIAKGIAQDLFRETSTLLPGQFLQLGYLRDLTGIDVFVHLLRKTGGTPGAGGNNQLEISVFCCVPQELQYLPEGFLAMGVIHYKNLAA